MAIFHETTLYRANGGGAQSGASPGQVLPRGARQTRSECWVWQSGNARPTLPSVPPPLRCQYCKTTHRLQTHVCVEETHWPSLIFNVWPLKVSLAVVVSGFHYCCIVAKDFGLELIKVKKLSKLSKVSLIVMQQSVQGVVFLFLVLVSGEDLHDFLGLNVPFFNRDSGSSSCSICCYLRGIVVIAVNISCHISLPPQTDTNIIMPM